MKDRKRTQELIADFKDGFAARWYMAVKESFRDELDIKWNELKNEWMQGSDYCFSEGQILYDSRQAYDNWQQALNNIKIACQIVEAKPNMPEKYVNEVTGKTNFRTAEGFVKFILYKPNAERRKLNPFIGYKMTQNEFVNYLKYGPIILTPDQ